MGSRYVGIFHDENRSWDPFEAMLFDSGILQQPRNFVKNSAWGQPGPYPIPHMAMEYLHGEFGSQFMAVINRAAD
ncbi:MAG: hypothetical protein CM1200mP18_15390 [Gammaproteobacteria bacterium]|nr:MAG: hypothetical protein CM1200mP18_15390 [Gammaproteobacteria bacterium]